MAGYIRVMLLLPLLIATSTRTVAEKTIALPGALPPQGAWSFGQCLKATFAARLTIPYTNMDETVSNRVIDVPYQAVPDSSHCNSRVSTFLLRFFPDPNNYEQHWEFSLTFVKHGNDRYKIENATLQYVIDDHFPVTAKHGGQWFRHSSNSLGLPTAADVGSYISCSSVDYQLGSKGPSVELFYLKIQPFTHEVKDHGYGTRGPCLKHVEKDEPTDSGPSKTAVVVCVFLVLLIAIIIGAVLYNRKKMSHDTIRYQRS